MSPKCSAPIEGHGKSGSAANCPLHGAAPKKTGGPATPVKRPIASRRVLSAEESALRDELTLKAKDDDVHVRESAARHESTPPLVLRRLAKDRDDVVLEAVAQNPYAPGVTLMSLAGDFRHSVRLRVAQNPSTPPAALEILAGDVYGETRIRAVEHPRMPKRVLGEFAKHDHDAAVRSAAMCRVQFLMSRRLDVDPANEGARMGLLDQAWWEMDATDPAVVLAKTLSPNP